MILVDSFCLEMHCEIGKYSCLGLGYIFPTAMNLFFDCHCLQLWFENHVLLSIWLPPCFLELFILWQNATVNVVYMKIYVISFKYKVKCEMIWIGLNLQCVVLMFLKISFETIWHLIFMSSYWSFFCYTTKQFKWHSANSTSQCIWFLHSGFMGLFLVFVLQKKSNR